MAFVFLISIKRVENRLSKFVNILLARVSSLHYIYVKLDMYGLIEGFVRDDLRYRVLLLFLIILTQRAGKDCGYSRLQKIKVKFVVL